MSTIQYALSQHQQGNLQQAESLYRQLILNNISDINANLYLGILLLNTKRAQEAIGFLRRAYELQPRNSQVIVALSDGLFETNCIEQAIQVVENEAVNHSDLAIKHLNLLAEKEGNELSFFKKIFNKYNSIWPTNLKLKSKMASIAKAKGNLNYSRQIYLEILKKEPNRKSSIHNLAVVERLLNNPSRALKLLKKVVSLGDDSYQLHHNLANTHTDLSNLDSAVMHYERAIERNPYFDDSYKNLTQILFELGDIEGAIRPYQQALQKGHISESLVFGYCDNLIQLKRCLLYTSPSPRD